MKLYIDENQPALREKLFWELLNGSLNPEEEYTKARMKKMRLPLFENRYRIVLMEDYKTGEIKMNRACRTQACEEVYRILFRTLSEECELCQCKDERGRMCVAICDRTGNPVPPNYGKAWERVIIPMLKERHDIVYGVCRICDTCKELPRAYRESDYELRRSYVTNGSWSEEDQQQEPDASGYQVQMATYLNLHDYNKIQDTLKARFDEIRSCREPEMLLMLTVELLAPCIRYLKKYKEPAKPVIERYFQHMFDDMMLLRSVEEYEEYCQQIYSEAIKVTLGVNNIHMSRPVELAIHYIEQHYREPDLTIGRLAKEIYLNHTYLCSVFKKETGLTLNDYLLKYRLKKAVGFMKTGRVLVLEAAEEAGFSNVNYFGKCFKKEFGVTPGQYLGKIKKPEDFTLSPETCSFVLTLVFV